MLSPFVQSLIAFVSAVGGAAVANSLGVSHKQLCALISFAAGTLLATTFFHIVPDTWNVLPLSVIVIALLSGYFLFYVISRYVFHVCPACAASHFEEQTETKLKSFVVLLVIALSIHSLMDGIAIALGKHLAPNSERSIFFTITIHKFPEGLALCALLLRAGYERLKALRQTILFEISTLVGWALGATLSKGLAENAWLDLMLLHIGGGFVYLALHATVNEMERHSPRFVFLFFLAGVILMGLVR